MGEIQRSPVLLLGMLPSYTLGGSVGRGIVCVLIDVPFSFGDLHGEELVPFLLRVVDGNSIYDRLSSARLDGTCCDRLGC